MFICIYIYVDSVSLNWKPNQREYFFWSTLHSTGLHTRQLVIRLVAVYVLNMFHNRALKYLKLGNNQQMHIYNICFFQILLITNCFRSLWRSSSG